LISDYVSKQQTSSGGLNEELFGFNICGGHIRPDWKHQPKIKIKLTLLGASGVGKTVLGRSLQYGQWPKSMSFPTATIGPDILFYHLDQLFRNEYVVAIQLNDPPGQEKFEAVTDHFFKQCHGALLVSDTTNLESLIRIKQFWYPRLTKLGIDNLESVLVCTKTDLFEKKDKIYRDSFLQHAEEFAFAHQIPIVHVSAYRGDNVEHVFKQLISRILTNEALIKDLIAEARYPNDLNIRQNQTAFRLTSTPKQEQRKNKKLPCCK
jgi:small GTP-binding protein